METSQENEDISCYATLKPHRYPLFITVPLLGVIITFIYFITIDLPISKKIAQQVFLADNSFENKLYKDTLVEYHSLFKTFDSPELRLRIAMTLFEIGNEEFDTSALTILQGVTLSQKQYEKLSLHMPEEYHEYFETIEKKKCSSSYRVGSLHS